MNRELTEVSTNTQCSALAIVGILLHMGLFVAYVVAFLIFVPALGLDVPNIDIHLALYISIYCIIASIIGWSILVLVLVVYRYHEFWFRSTMLAIAILWAPYFPIGTVMALFVVLYLFSLKKS